MLKRLLVGLIGSVCLALACTLSPASPAAAAVLDTPNMSRPEFKAIKKGMSYAQVRRIVGGRGDCTSYDQMRSCTWRYRGEVGFAMVFFNRAGLVKNKWWTVWHGRS